MKKNLLAIWLFIATIIITSLLTYLRVNSTHVFHGDTGQLYLILQNLYEGMGAYNPIQPSLIEFMFERNLTHLSPELICSQDLIPRIYDQASYNHFQFHSYFILYPISLLINIVNPEYLIHWFNILSFISVLAISAYILKSENLDWIKIILALSLVMIYPGWSWAIQGQPYVDRFYLPFSLLIFYLVNKYKHIDYKILIIIFISSLIAEKTIIYNSIFLISYLILNYKNISVKNRKYFLLLGFILAIAFYMLTKFYINNLYYSSAIPKDLNTFLNIFNSENFKNGILSLILTSAPILFPALLFQRKLFLNALIMLGPNIIGDIGGAEKVGFSTHYHSLYFGYLIFPYLMSICFMYKNFNRTSYLYILIFDILYFSIGYGDQNKIKFHLPINSQGNFVLSFFNDYKTLTNKTIWMDVIRKNIPINSAISTTETGMPFLYLYKNLYFYPLNIEKSDYLILNYSYENNHMKYYGYYGHLGNSHNAMVDRCLMTKYSNLYDFDNPVKINNYLAIIKRK